LILEDTNGSCDRYQDNQTNTHVLERRRHTADLALVVVAERSWRVDAARRLSTVVHWSDMSPSCHQIRTTHVATINIHTTSLTAVILPLTFARTAG